MGRIVHFGLGNFARAHLLDYTADAGGWDVVGVSLRGSTIRDGLAEQGFDYDLCVQGVGAKRITILKDVLVAPENPAAVISAMGQADIISATVTEKGYHLDAQGLLDLEDPAIVGDVKGEGPATLVGFLARHLARRKSPLTVMSCDNMVENGEKLRAAIVRFAGAAGLENDWQNVIFPNAMVDRITPATTDALRAARGDPMAVPTEAFREWVIEDRFAGPRPNWPEVQIVQDVAPHELRKLRMLNGAHSMMAYAGLLKGHAFVHEAVADADLRRDVMQLMEAAGATLPVEMKGQVASYAKALITRFENAELAHRLDQIAMDGSQKVPYRLVDTLRAGGGKAAAGIRAWIKFCVSEVEQGRALSDPMGQQIAQAVQGKAVTADLLTLIGAQDILPLIAE